MYRADSDIRTEEQEIKLGANRRSGVIGLHYPSIAVNSSDKVTDQRRDDAFLHEGFWIERWRHSFPGASDLHAHSVRLSLIDEAGDGDRIIRSAIYGSPGELKDLKFHLIDVARVSMSHFVAENRQCKRTLLFERILTEELGSQRHTAESFLLPCVRVHKTAKGTVADAFRSALPFTDPIMLDLTIALRKDARLHLRAASEVRPELMY